MKVKPLEKPHNQQVVAMKLSPDQKSKVKLPLILKVLLAQEVFKPKVLDLKRYSNPQAVKLQKKRKPKLVVALREVLNLLLSKLVQAPLPLQVAHMNLM
jgi:hypothetical protein